VVVLAYKLTLSVDKGLAKPREAVTFTAKLTADTSPVAGATVEFYIMNPYGTPDVRIGSATTGSDGSASYAWTVPFYVDFRQGRAQLGCNTWVFYAYYPGAVIYSDTVSVKVANPTRLALATDKDSYRAGETVVVTVKLEYEYPADTWNPLAGKTVTITAFGTSKSVTTGSDGSASTSFTAPSTPGTYTITASFAGEGLGLAPAVARLALSVGAAGAVVAVAAPVAVGAILALLARRM
jgi:uncharacterized protein YfaS (alpha-2-macroglobulin family)